MTFLQLQQLTSDILDDVNNVYFTLERVKQWINFAQLEAQKLLLQTGEHWYTTIAEQATTIGAPRYALPSDFLKCQRLELVLSGTVPNEDTSTLEPITLNQQDLVNSTSGTPAGYYLRRNYLTVLPTPNATQTMRLYYSYKVTDMTIDADTPDIPNQYHEMLALMAAREGFNKDNRDPSILNEKIAMYQKMMEEDAEDRREDQPRMIVQTQAAGYDYLF